MALMRLTSANGAALDFFDMVAGKVAMELVLASTAPHALKAIALFDLLPPPSIPPLLHHGVWVTGCAVDKGEFEAMMVKAIIGKSILVKTYETHLEMQLRTANLEITALQSQVLEIKQSILVKTSETQRIYDAALPEDDAGNQY